MQCAIYIVINWSRTGSDLKRIGSSFTTEYVYITVKKLFHFEEIAMQRVRWCIDNIHGNVHPQESNTVLMCSSDVHKILWELVEELGENIGKCRLIECTACYFLWYSENMHNVLAVFLCSNEFPLSYNIPNSKIRRKHKITLFRRWHRQNQFKRSVLNIVKVQVKQKNYSF